MLNVDIRGMTSFARRVYGVVAKIPRGKTLSYKEVARRAGSPRAFRAVGNVLNKNRNPQVPCHRVVQSDGRPGGYAWGGRLKAELLVREKKMEKFRSRVWRYYRAHGRNFPWRRTKNPHRILVSEIMLQQTQTSRVEKFYPAFIKKFPTVEALAEASTHEVLLAWQGLGYNRRALNLKRTADLICGKYNGKFPRAYEELAALPGVGQSTAGAIYAFAYQRQASFLETNIRTVFIHEFFGKRTDITDKELLPLVAETCDKKNPREWYFALMDYGVMLKRKYGNASRRSALYKSQGLFEGSHRYFRAAALREILQSPRATPAHVAGKLGVSVGRARSIMRELGKEGFIVSRI